MAQVLVINSGSSSVKYQLLDMEGPTVLAGGTVERIGEGEDAAHRHHGDGGDGGERVETGAIPDHDEAFRRIFAALDEDGGDADELIAVGHRVVHGGEALVEATVVDDAVLEQIRAQIPLAPLHNPANIRGIEVARDLRGHLPQVAVFDTAFHRTLPAHAYRYALPDELYQRHGIRRYGFHGTSHQFVARAAAELLDRAPEDCNLITLHLGNGASVTAIEGGRSVDTSMGLSPLEGLVMGTRSGDIDPTVVFHLAREGMDLDDIETLLNRRSGLKGLAGANDLRELEARAADGDERAELALRVYCHRIRKYIGAYAAVLGRVDALVFTGGVGENSSLVRARCCAGLAAFGVLLDDGRNEGLERGRAVALQADHSRVAILVVPTDEELEIARQTLARVEGARAER
jgi:acetate kinase